MILDAGLTLLGGASGLVAVLGPVIIALWWLDRYDRQSPRQIVAATALGAAVAAVSLLALPGRTPWLAVLTDEGMVVLATWSVIALSRDVDGAADGVVFGAAVGCGYGVAESALRVVGGPNSSSPFMAPAAIVLLGAFGVARHGLAGAAGGGCLGTSSIAATTAGRLRWLLLAIVAATAIDSAGRWLRVGSAGRVLTVGSWSVAFGSVAIGFFLVIAGFLRLEHRVLARQLGEEVELRVVPPWVVDIIPYYRRRLRSGWWPLRRERTVLSRLLTRLAFRKQAIMRLSADDVRVAGLEVVQLRKRVRTVLGVRGAHMPQDVSD